jgi:hypothetical protein
MNENSVQQRARTVLALFTAVVAVQLLGIAPGIEYISGAFPTYFHRAESAAITFSLFISLITVSFSSSYLRSIALTILGALMFYSCYKAVIGFSSSEAMHARAIWISVSLVMTAALGWVVFGAFRLGILRWRGLFLSLAFAYVGLIYLRLAAGLNG